MTENLLNMIKIRKIQIDDLVSVKQIDKSVFGEMTYPLFVLRQFYDANRDYFFVATCKNEIVGYTLGAVNCKSKVAWILALGTKKEFQGNGIGRKLTNVIMNCFSDANMKVIFLTVKQNNIPALKLYKSLGFYFKSKDSNYYLDNDERIIMVKENLNL